MPNFISYLLLQNAVQTIKFERILIIFTYIFRTTTSKMVLMVCLTYR